MPSLRKLLPSPGGLIVFESAGRLGSFTKAAEELGMTQAAVSYSIRQLERSVAASLFLREHRAVRLTEVGERFHQDVTMGLGYIRRSAEALVGSISDAHVTLSVSTAFATYWMMPRMARFHKDLPDIDLRLQTTAKDVDLRAEQIPLGVRRGFGDWPEYECGLLAKERIFAVASAASAFKRGGRLPLDGLSRQKLIHLEEPFRPRPTWEDWFKSFGVTFKDRGDGLRLNDYALVIQAALEAEGIALGWEHLVERLVSVGLLAKVSRRAFVTGAGFYITWPKSMALSKDAARVRDWLLNEKAA